MDRKAVEDFVANWTKAQGSEKSECQQFWRDLLEDVLGVKHASAFIHFEEPVYYNDGSTKFLDGWIPASHVLIEQKSRDIDLDAPQSGHDNHTPFEQAWEYDNNRPVRDKARWIVVCNFDEIRIHDMEADRPETTFETIRLADLAKESHRLSFLVQDEGKIRTHEQEVSIKAGRVVGKLYNAFLEQYGELAQDPEVLKNLNKLCVRLIFCVYAEDAGVFEKDQFLTFLRKFHYESIHLQLGELFKVLRQRPEERGPFVPAELKAFPYVGGGLFREDIPIAPFSEKTARILLDEASEQFDWGEISPTIFGAVFESTLNPETRRKGGMHYTSEENIHKVIDSLFLDELKKDFAAIKVEPNIKRRDADLEKFQQRLGSLRFLDPACGSGNFLTETYLSLRKLENEALNIRFHGQGQLLLDDCKLIHVSINQFYGIEINDFAVTVAQTAMWIAECKMMEETNSILAKNLTPLPLTDSAKIVEGNALRMDWEENLRLNERLPDIHFDYIMGNPPFVGARWMGAAQKDDVADIFNGWKNFGNLDYVTCWYKKAADLMRGTKTTAAFVSTNSICQGDSVAILWKPLFAMGVEIDFAWRTFVWDSEATDKAHVHCVIVGFHCRGKATESTKDTKPLLYKSGNSTKTIYEGDNATHVSHINAYLMDGSDVWIESHSKPTCEVPEIVIGSQPIDDGNYLFDDNEKRDFLLKEPAAASHFHLWTGSQEYINNKFRHCLWLGDCSPSELRTMPECMKRVSAVRDFRLKSKRVQTLKSADYPSHFATEIIPTAPYILIPKVSSERRRYIPIGLMDPSVFCSDLVFMIPNAALYHFGVLISSIHMAWMRAVAGRLKSDYRYSANIVYNNFPWPDGVRGAPALPTGEERDGHAGRVTLPGDDGRGTRPACPRSVSGASEESELTKSQIEQTAQGILDARAQYPDSSLADLYDELTMPPELRKAHRANDAAVMAAYGFDPNLTEPEIVAKLFEMYQQLTKSAKE